MGNWMYNPGVYDFKGTKPPTTFSLNSSLFHFLYLPSTILFTIPVKIIMELVFGWFDIRILYLIAYVITLYFATKMVKKESQISFLAIFSLNPMLFPYIIEDRNDILAISLIILSVFFTSKGKLWTSAIILAIAAASKQIALPILPFYLVYIYLHYNAKILIKFFTFFTVTFLIIILPFFLWNPNAFVNDTIKFISSTEFKIKGLSFGMLLVALGVIKNTASAYPANLFTVIAGLPTLVCSLIMIKRNPSINTVLLFYCLMLFVIYFFSRAFNINYLGVILEFLILAYFIKEESQQ
jgi:uncharacterized membrane protein